MFQPAAAFIVDKQCDGRQRPGQRITPEHDDDRIDEHHRHKDVFEHTMIVIDRAVALETGPDGPVPAPAQIRPGADAVQQGL